MYFWGRMQSQSDYVRIDSKSFYPTITTTLICNLLSLRNRIWSDHRQSESKKNTSCIPDRVFLHSISGNPGFYLRDRKLESIIAVQWGRKIPTRGSNVPAENEACRVCHWSAGPEGWHFPVVTENQWWILFLECHHANSIFFSRCTHGNAGTK